MVLVDTSVWIDHLHVGVPALVDVLERDEVGCHPLVIEELALCSIKRRDEMLDLLSNLAAFPVLTHPRRSPPTGLPSPSGTRTAPPDAFPGPGQRRHPVGKRHRRLCLPRGPNQRRPHGADARRAVRRWLCASVCVRRATRPILPASGVSYAQPRFRRSRRRASARQRGPSPQDAWQHTFVPCRRERESLGSAVRRSVR